MSPAESDTEDEFNLVMLRSLAVIWLDVRDDLLCSLSRIDGEWPNCEDIVRPAKQLRGIAELLRDYAGKISDDNGTSLIQTILDNLADAHGYTKEVNWSLSTQTQ